MPIVMRLDVMLAKRKRSPKPGDDAPRPPLDGEARRS